MSALERLPMEILEPIFLQSMNCDLPLVSKRLLAALSKTSIQLNMVITILVSKNTPAQSALLRRRFFDFPIYEEAAKYIYKNNLATWPGDEQPPHPWLHCCTNPFKCRPPLLEKDVELCERMLENSFAMFCWADRYFRRDEYPMFSYTWLPPNLLEPSIIAAAQQTIHSNLERGRLVIDMLRYFDYDDRVEFWFQPRESTVKLTIITQNCKEPNIVLILFKKWKPQWEEIDAELQTWYTQRKSEDSLAREGDEYLGIVQFKKQSGRICWESDSPSWIGEWVEELCKNLLTGDPLQSYPEFFEQRLKADVEGKFFR
ncbi:MAG: hypothetical protein M1829_006209 [Trizodia sp. TS-e1964]|nr:MAG: hypothetical protein M1829_006209 [Trizodia sp. TS-e1964]